MTNKGYSKEDPPGASLALWLETWLTRLEGLGALSALLLILLLASYQSLGRNLDWPTPGWIDPFLHKLVLWAGLLGAGLGIRRGGHIRFDLFTPRMGVGLGRKVRSVISVVSAGVCLLLGWAAWRFVVTEREAGASLLGVPEWVFALILPLSFGLMALHFVLEPWLPVLTLPPAAGAEGWEADPESAAGRPEAASRGEEA